jgi:hypothetical protein
MAAIVAASIVMSLDIAWFPFAFCIGSCGPTVPSGI